MALWYYKVDGEEVGPTDETMLEVLVSVGSITADTPVRRARQEAWQAAGRSPLAHLLAAGGEEAPSGDGRSAPSEQPLPSDEAPDGETSGESGNRNIWLVGVLRYSVLVGAVVSALLALLFSWSFIEALITRSPVLKEFSFSFSLDASTLPHSVQFAAWVAPYAMPILQIALPIFIFVVYLMWVYRASAAAFEAPGTFLVADPSLAVLWHLVPLVNLVMLPVIVGRLLKISLLRSYQRAAKSTISVAVLWISCAIPGFLILSLEGMDWFLPDDPQAMLALIGEMAFQVFFVAVLAAYVLSFWCVPAALLAFRSLERRISPILLGV